MHNHYKFDDILGQLLGLELRIHISDKYHAILLANREFHFNTFMIKFLHNITGGVGTWSSDNCREVTCPPGRENQTCCECYQLGHFGLLLVRKYNALKQ